MASSGTTRSAAYNDQQASAKHGPKPSVPSSRLGAQGRPESREDVFPQDSASNAPRRTPSDASRANGSTRITSERQTERIRFSTKDNVRIHTQSPVKESLDNAPGDREPKTAEPARVNSRATERLPTATRKKKEALRELKLTYDAESEI